MRFSARLWIIIMIKLIIYRENNLINSPYFSFRRVTDAFSWCPSCRFLLIPDSRWYSLMFSDCRLFILANSYRFLQVPVVFDLQEDRRSSIGKNRNVLKKFEKVGKRFGNSLGGSEKVRRSSKSFGKKFEKNMNNFEKTRDLWTRKFANRPDLMECKRVVEHIAEGIAGHIADRQVHCRMRELFNRICFCNLSSGEI